MWAENENLVWLANTSEREGVSPFAPCAAFSSRCHNFRCCASRNKCLSQPHACSALLQERWFHGEPLPSPSVPERNKLVSADPLDSQDNQTGPTPSTHQLWITFFPSFFEKPREPRRPCWVHLHEGCLTHTKVVSTAN